MTEIYLIRHTQAEGNLFRAMQGHWDGDVTALGLQEIDALAERMRDVKIDALYASDLKRAVLTAGAIRRSAHRARPARDQRRPVGGALFRRRGLGAARDDGHLYPPRRGIFPRRRRAL